MRYNSEPAQAVKDDRNPTRTYKHVGNAVHDFGPGSTSACDDLTSPPPRPAPN